MGVNTALQKAGPMAAAMKAGEPISAVSMLNLLLNRPLASVEYPPKYEVVVVYTLATST